MTSSPESADRNMILSGILCLLFLIASWLAAFFYAPVDANQGAVYRIMFLHVPSAFTAFSVAFCLFVLSVMGLKSRSENTLIWAKATAEVGLLFTALTLATGSIWGRPTWGTWWTWDARLTTTFLLGLLYAGYLLLHSAMGPGPGRVRVCSALGILIFIDVPIIYQSVTWWRTLHQPPSMLRRGGSTMEPDILWTLLFCIVVMVACGLWLVRQRGRNLQIQDAIEAASFAQIKH
jgi:heme exporter protein C